MMKLSIAGNRIQGNYSLQETGIVMLGRAKVAGDNKFSNNRVIPEKAVEYLKTMQEVNFMQAISEKDFIVVNDHQKRHVGQW